MMKRRMKAVLGLSMVLTFGVCGNAMAAQKVIKAPAKIKVIETDVKKVDIGSKKVDELLGGWSLNQGSILPQDNQDAMKAFEKATKNMVGYRYEVLGVLGKQVVAGTNYAYLCKGSVVIPEAKPEYVIVNVYEDLDGQSSITGTKDLVSVLSAGQLGCEKK